MPERDPEFDDRELRAAFESFHTQALDDMSPAGADAVRATVRRRHRTRMTVTGVAAAVVLVAAAGAGVLATHHPPNGPQHVTAASTTGPTRSPAPRQSPPASMPPQPSPGGQSAAPPDTSDGGGTTRQVALRLANDPVPLPTRSAGTYHGSLSVTVSNPGTEPIPRATVELTIPATMSFTGDGDTATCSGTAGTCVLRSFHNLAPGATQTVSGTLSYGSGAGPADPATSESGTVRVTAADADGTELATEAQAFTVALGRTPSPSPRSSPSTLPSGSPSVSAPAD